MKTETEYKPTTAEMVEFLRREAARSRVIADLSAVAKLDWQKNARMADAIADRLEGCES